MEASAVLFDLDDTLIHQDRSDDEAMVAALGSCLDVEGSPYTKDELIKLVRTHASRLWWGHDLGPYCRSVGISPCEGMWGRFESNDPKASALRPWAHAYRRELWSCVLGELGIGDAQQAEGLADAFITERRTRQVLFPEALSVLDQLRGRYALGLVTNGASDLQQEKITAAGIGHYFDVVTISGELGVGKPDPHVFDVTLSRLGLDRTKCAMVGNNLEADIAGAVRSGIAAIWVNRTGATIDRAVHHVDLEIQSLDELPHLKGVAEKSQP